MINAFGYLLAFLGVQSQVPQRGYASLCTPYDFVIPVRHAAPNPESIIVLNCKFALDSGFRLRRPRNDSRTTAGCRRS
jgi:hypothetical protein